MSGPLEKDTQALLEDEINDTIALYNPYETCVSLPNQSSFGKITFYTITKKPSVIFIPLAIISAILIYFIGINDIKKQLQSREEALLLEYPEFVEKLLLLCNAGLTIRNALVNITEGYIKTHQQKSYLIQELEYILHKLKSGYSESDVYAEFGKRCKLQSYMKLATLLEQNLKRGNSNLKSELQLEVRQAFLSHKNYVLQAGEKASTKLLFPMILILIVVIGLIMIPSFLSMSNL